MTVENPVYDIDHQEIVGRRDSLIENLRSLGYSFPDVQIARDQREGTYISFINSATLRLPEIKTALEEYTGKEIDPELLGRNYSRLITTLDERLTNYIAGIGSKGRIMPFWLTYDLYGDEANKFVNEILGSGGSKQTLDALVEFYLSPYDLVKDGENRIDQIISTGFKFRDYSKLAETSRFSNNLERAALEYALKLDKPIKSPIYNDIDSLSVMGYYKPSTREITVHEKNLRRMDRIRAAMTGALTGISYSISPIIGILYGASMIGSEAIWGDKERYKRRDRILNHEIVHDLGFSIGTNEGYNGVVAKKGIEWSMQIEDLVDQVA